MISGDRSFAIARIKKKLTPEQCSELSSSQSHNGLIVSCLPRVGELSLEPQPSKKELSTVTIWDRRVRGSSFPVLIVLMGLLLMLRAATSLRGAAKSIEISEELYRGRFLAGPCHNTVRNHLLRIGLYELNRAKAKLADWVWIVDHTIQVGHQLCMVVLGIPLSKFQQLGRPLQCTDMQVLEMLPMEKSNGEIMGVHFTDLANRYGHPVAVVSDEGSDISGGFNVLCQSEQATAVRCIDIVHKMSRLIKKILERQEKWSEYRKQSCATGNRLRQSQLGHLPPPKPKTKARHMNLGPEIEWGMGILRLRDGIDTNADYNDEQRKKLLDTTDWLENYRGELAGWSELMSISRDVCEVVRRYGYDTLLVQRVERAMGLAKTEMGAELIEQTLAFLEVQQSRCHESLGKLPGVSEVIESLFGKGKRLEGQQSRSGFTAQLLAMAACVVDLTEEIIAEAFASVSTAAVSDWQNEKLGPSVQSRRCRDLGKKRCQKPAQENAGVNPNCAQD